MNTTTHPCLICDYEAGFTCEQVARAVQILRKEGIDTAEKFETLLAASERRQSAHIRVGGERRNA